jgi:hypothetical protein
MTERSTSMFVADCPYCPGVGWSSRPHAIISKAAADLQHHIEMMHDRFLPNSVFQLSVRRARPEETANRFTCSECGAGFPSVEKCLIHKLDHQ